MTLKFKSEYTPLATKGRIRLGIAKISSNDIKIEVIKKQIETSKTIYDVCISKGNGWTWIYGVNLNKVYSIISIILNAELIPLQNEF